LTPELDEASSLAFPGCIETPQPTDRGQACCKATLRMGCPIFRTMRCALAACILWWVGMFLFGASTIMNDVDEAERTLFSRMRSAPRAVEVPEAKFRIWESTRGICGSASIGNDTITASPAEAERLCERTEGCTFFTRWGETSTSVCSLPSTAWPKDEYFRAGTTVLCKKFMSLDHQEASSLWVSGAYVECDTANSEADCRTRPCGVCPTEAPHLVLACGPRGRHVCHECRAAACPELLADVLQTYSVPMLQMAREQPESPIGLKFVVFNPAFFELGGRRYAVVRLTDQGRCDGRAWMPPPKQPYQSHTILCQVSGEAARGCRRLTIDVAKQLKAHGSKYVAEGDGKDHFTDFKGLEDARAFVLDGTVHLTGSVVVKNGEEISTRMLLISLDMELAVVARAVVLYVAAGGDCKDRGDNAHKNWMFLSAADDGKDSTLVFVSSVHPYLLVRCRLPSGCCQEERGRSSIATKELEGYHGGPVSVPVPGSDSLLLVVHRRVDFEPLVARSLQGIYHHRFLLVDAAMPHVLQNASSPFRLPGVAGEMGEGMASAAQDIQFVSGAYFDAGRILHLGYGVGDCVPVVAKLSSPWCWPLPFRPAPTPEPKAWLRLRLEGPIRSMQSFAHVNRRFADMLVGFTGVRLDVLDTGTLDDFNAYQESRAADGSADDEQLWAGSIIEDNTVNAQSSVFADFTLRNLWPVELHRPVAGRAIINFPWEFYHVPGRFARAFASQWVAEVWVPTAYVKQGLVDSGVPESKIAIVPHGVDHGEVCIPADGTPSDTEARSEVRANISKTCRQGDFVFLYHGGVLNRKAVDKIAEAFSAQFSGDDNVCLVIHAGYGDEEAFDNLTKQINRSTSVVGAQQRRILPLFKIHLSRAQRSELFSRSHVLVHPSRSEGFGLSIAEAMACGLPVITTDRGAVADFTSADTVWQVTTWHEVCTLQPCSIRQHGGWGIFGEHMPQPPLWLNFNVSELGELMRHVWQNPSDVTAKQIAAQAFIRDKFTWAQVQAVILQRLKQLAPGG